MRTRRSLVLAASVVMVMLVAGGQAGAGSHEAGGHDRHGQAPPQGGPAQGGPAQGGATQGDDVDRAFAAGMVPHHQAAIDMARVELDRGEKPKVRKLAQSILDDQQKQLSWLSEQAQQKWGSRPDAQRVGPLGVLMDMPLSMDMSTTAGQMTRTTNVDQMFLEMMLVHHAVTISMAQEEVDRGGDPRFQRLAATVLASRARDMGKIQAMLDNAGGQPGRYPPPGRTASGDDVDRAFTAMVPHHQSAIEMARVELDRGRQPDVRQLAQAIFDDQQNEIMWMSQQAELKWGFRPERQRPGPMGVVMDMPLNMDMTTMTDHMSQTTNVDRMFLQMMIAHHAAAVVMAQEELDQGADPRFRRMAGTVISSQARQIGQIQQMLDKPGPRGW